MTDLSNAPKIETTQPQDGNVDGSEPLATFAIGPGDGVFKEGDQSDFAFIIVSGRVELSKTVQGTEIFLAEIGPGDLFGEMGVIDGSPRSASAVALEPVPAITGTRPFAASTQSSVTRMCSAGVSVGDSPVVPTGTRPCVPSEMCHSTRF